MLSKGDDYPLHQTAEPIAYAGTDRHFYDRYFFNGYAPAAGDARMVGSYPQLDIADAHFSWMTDHKQISRHASCWRRDLRLALPMIIGGLSQVATAGRRPPSLEAPGVAIVR